MISKQINIYKVWSNHKLEYDPVIKIMFQRVCDDVER